MADRNLAQPGRSDHRQSARSHDVFAVLAVLLLGFVLVVGIPAFARLAAPGPLARALIAINATLRVHLLPFLSAGRTLIDSEGSHLVRSSGAPLAHSLMQWFGLALINVVATRRLAPRRPILSAIVLVAAMWLASYATFRICSLSVVPFRAPS